MSSAAEILKIVGRPHRLPGTAPRLATEAVALQFSLGDPIPAEAMRSIERTLQLQHFKWDTQVGDTSVLLPQPVLIAESEWNWLCRKAEQAAQEIYLLEQTIAGDPKLQRLIGIPRQLGKLLAPCAPENGMRTLRFDFHPTASGWRISEVNTDVPGGFGEASALQALFQPHCGNLLMPPCPLTGWSSAVKAEIERGHVALLYAPGYLEDTQVVLGLSRELAQQGYTPHLIQSPEALRWRDGCAHLRTDQSVRLKLIVRFYQAEWLAELPDRSGWRELFKKQEITRVLNPTPCVISESKRLPLSFGADCSTLRELFPECRDPQKVGEREREEWVLKAAYSNTGDAVHIGTELTRDAWKRLLRTAQRNSSRWIAQRKFETMMLESIRGLVRPCIGVFVIGNRTAGAYVRLSRSLVTDAHAMEAPLFIVPEAEPI